MKKRKYTKTEDLKSLQRRPGMKITVKCKKCGHEVGFRESRPTSTSLKWLTKMCKEDCPECGEEPENNWILSEVKYNYAINVKKHLKGVFKE